MAKRVAAKSSTKTKVEAKSASTRPPAKAKPPVSCNLTRGSQIDAATGHCFGSHLSIAGSMTNALLEAEKLGLSTVQVFTKNQQQWKAKPLDPAAVGEWRREQSRLGWDGRTVSHASYLINLASPDDALWAKSVDLMHEEIERCQTLGIAFLVHHPGAFTTSNLDDGLARIAKAYAELFKRTKGYTVVSCLENTAGGGSTIGRTFDELACLRKLIIDATGSPDRVGYCIDTCHALAGGYDLSSTPAAQNTLALLDQHLGFEHVRVLHLNDSKGALNSRLDRHEHIGDGAVGKPGFAAVLACEGLAGRPMILETPKGQNDAGEEWDTVNLARLHKLLPKPGSTAKR